MAIRKEEKVIGNATYYCTQWSAQKAILMKFKLFKAFGSSIALLGSLAKDEKESVVRDISDGISQLFKNNSPESLIEIINECISGVAVQKEGEEAVKISHTNFDMIFETDNLIDIYKVFFFVLGTNYSNLLKSQKLEGILAKAKDIL